MSFNSRVILQVGLTLLFFGMLLVPTKAHGGSPTPETPPTDTRLINPIDMPWRKAEPSRPEAAGPTAQPALISGLTEASRVTFQSLRDNNWEIYTSLGDGSNQTRLTFNSAADIDPRLQRGGTRIAFASNLNGNFDIYTMNLDGSGLTQLTFDPADDVAPFWSPDGNQIVFQSERDGQVEIYKMSADGLGQTRLTADGGYDGTPAWSPNGDQIAWAAYRNGGYRIWIMNADGSGATQRSNQPYSFNPVWSPDGSQIAYDSDGNTNGWQDIWVMNNDGTNQHQGYAPYEAQTDTWVHSWSPDNRYIAYTRISYVFYQGTWYWTAAYLDAWDTTANWAFVRLSGQSTDWNPDWQTLDTTAPQSAVRALPTYVRVDNLSVSWQGNDIGLAGIANYDVQYKVGIGGAWTDWQMNTANTTANFTGNAGNTVYFRTRARDLIGNLEAWPAEADASTTLFSSELSGQVMDNRANPVAGLALNTTPMALTSAVTGADGWYKTLLALTGTYTLTSQAGPYGTIAPTALRLNPDQQYSFYVPPANDLVVNGSFEANPTGLDGWQVSGSQMPTITTTKHSLGNQAALLALSCPQAPFCLTAAEVMTNVDYSGGPDIEVDNIGKVHMVWRGSAISYGGHVSAIYYAYRTAAGWSTPEVVDDFVDFSQTATGTWPRMVVAQDGTVHVVYWDDVGVYYAARSPLTGQWTTPLDIRGYPISWTNLGVDIAVDSHGGVHIVYLGPDIMYRERLPDGTWKPNLAINVGYRYPAVAVGPDDTVHIVWQQSGVGLFHTSRSPSGVWGPKTLFYSYWATVSQIQAIADLSGQLHVFWGWEYRRRNTDGRWVDPENRPRLGVSDVDMDPNGFLHFVGYTTVGSPGSAYVYLAPGDNVWSQPVVNNDGQEFVKVAVGPKGDVHLITAQIPSLYYRETAYGPDVQDAQLSQVIAIPNDMYRPTLAFNYTLFGVNPFNGQHLEVTIADVMTTTTVFSTTQNHDWRHAWVDLEPWAGQTITVAFSIARSSSEDGYSRIGLDDVSLGSWMTPQLAEVTPDHVTDLQSLPVTLTLTGDNFIHTPIVKIGDFILDKEVTWVDEHTLEVVLPSGIGPGIYDVWVVNPGGATTVRLGGLKLGYSVFLPVVARN